MSYSVRLTVTNPLLAGASTVEAFLEIAPAATGPWTTIAAARNLSQVGLSVTLALTTSNDSTLFGVVPAGWFARVRTATAGTAVAPVLVAQQESVFQ